MEMLQSVKICKILTDSLTDLFHNFHCRNVSCNTAIFDADNFPKKTFHAQYSQVWLIPPAPFSPAKPQEKELFALYIFKVSTQPSSFQWRMSFFKSLWKCTLQKDQKSHPFPLLIWLTQKNLGCIAFQVKKVHLHSVLVKQDIGEDFYSQIKTAEKIIPIINKLQRGHQ